jgi:hypothetical protein
MDKKELVWIIQCNKDQSSTYCGYVCNCGLCEPSWFPMHQQIYCQRLEKFILVAFLYLKHTHADRYTHTANTIVDEEQLENDDIYNSSLLLW